METWRLQELCFKPCYKWNTFNTSEVKSIKSVKFLVLNLIISGIPSIPWNWTIYFKRGWIVLNLVINGIPSILNSKNKLFIHFYAEVLNLVINGIPSIHKKLTVISEMKDVVLNLIINGIPSILYTNMVIKNMDMSFKPYYKWNTFNT